MSFNLINQWRVRRAIYLDRRLYWITLTHHHLHSHLHLFVSGRSTHSIWINSFAASVRRFDFVALTVCSVANNFLTTITTSTTTTTLCWFGLNPLFFSFSFHCARISRFARERPIEQLSPDLCPFRILFLRIFRFAFPTASWTASQVKRGPGYGHTHASGSIQLRSPALLFSPLLCTHTRSSSLSLFCSEPLS